MSSHERSVVSRSAASRERIDQPIGQGEKEMIKKQTKKTNKRQSSS